MSYEEVEFQKVHASYRARIQRYLTRLVGEHEAEDLTQEVFLKVAQGLESFRGESSLSTWVYRVATNAAVDRLRSPSFQRIEQQESLDVAIEVGKSGAERKNVWTGEENPSAEQQVVRQEMNECIKNFIGRLPENYRTVLVLAELEGFKNKEIAEILGVSLNTVKIRLHRATEKLKQELWQHCEAYWVEDNEFVPDLKEALEEYRKSA